MNLRWQEERDLVFVDKPYGISTHSPDLGRLGMVEIYAAELGQELHVVHRLDKTTSGALAFAKTPIAAAAIFELFKKREVEKTYWFLTDRRSEFPQTFVQSHIAKVGKSMQSTDVQRQNWDHFNEPLAAADRKKTFYPSQNEISATLFTRIKRNAFYELWQAEPLTGKQHQIRLHARDAGLVILGDTVYGGSPFPALCLHALTLKIPGYASWTCPAPRWFERLGWAHDLLMVEHLLALDRRERLYHFLPQKSSALRLEHTENARQRTDLLGEVLWMQWYAEREPDRLDLIRCELLGELLSRPWVLRRMRNRGKDPHAKIEWRSPDPVPEKWIITENGARFEMRANQGLSTGLFLDQRDARLWLRGRSNEKKILNLFAYTCGFSVFAALGGASAVTSVDVSSEFLNWGKENFRLNGLDDSLHEFSVQDSIVYLQGALKRSRKFDIVICDPPTFGRHKKGVFQLEKDWKALLEMIHSCLNKGGLCLFSFNLESRDPTLWEQQIRKSKLWELLPAPPRGLDYELPGEETLLKSFLLRRMEA